MRLVPSFDRIGHVESRAEARVAHLLNQVEVRSPEACLYSVHLPQHQYKQMSEVDFVIVWADLVLVVEVKGGRIGRRDGLWTFTDRYGHTNQKREGPLDQARSGMFALRDRLTERIPHLDVAFGYLVLTPDQDLAPDLEWDPQVLAGPGSMTIQGLERSLGSARRYWLAKARQPPSGRAYGELMQLLRPDFDLVPSLPAQARNLEQDFVQFADRQYELLLAAEQNQRIVCTGGAGSGKTLLAVETARRAAAEGASALVTCRSPQLAELIDTALIDSGVHCVPLDRTSEMAPVDVLVVDEAQDLLDLDSYARLDELIRGGWAQGRWRIFCDVNNQALVDGSFDRQVFDELMNTSTHVHLPFNCRNTATIVTQIQLLTGADLGVARAGQGPPVEYRQVADDQATADALDTRLSTLTRSGISESDIVVVSLRHSTADSAALLSATYRRHHLAVDGTPPGSHSLLVTSARIKGLEAAHVCVIDVDDLSTPIARARLYVAMTRARISLWVAAGERAWTQLAAPTAPAPGGSS